MASNLRQGIVVSILLLTVCTGACAVKSYHGVWAASQFIDRSATIHLMENPRANSPALEKELIDMLSILIESNGFSLTESAETAEYYVFLGYGTHAREGESWQHQIVVEVVDAERFRQLSPGQTEQHYKGLSRDFSSAGGSIGGRPGKDEIVVWRTMEALDDRTKDPANPLRKLHLLLARAAKYFGEGNAL